MRLDGFAQPRRVLVDFISSHPSHGHPLRAIHAPASPSPALVWFQTALPRALVPPVVVPNPRPILLLARRADDRETYALASSYNSRQWPPARSPVCLLLPGTGVLPRRSASLSSTSAGLISHPDPFLGAYDLDDKLLKPISRRMGILGHPGE
jgi:hypothetical protein